MHRESAEESGVLGYVVLSGECRASEEILKQKMPNSAAPYLEQQAEVHQHVECEVL